MLVLSKIIYLALVTSITTAMTQLLRKVQKELLWRKMKSKIKHDTQCNDFENIVFRSVDIF